MTKDEFDLWTRSRKGDELARKELVLFYMPLADVLAKRLARITKANWEDLRQDGTIGLIKAIERFDPGMGVPFRVYARPYIRGAIFNSSDLTRDLARRQYNAYRKIRQVETHLMETLHRNPTIEELAGKTGLTIERIRNAIDAAGVAFAGEFPNVEDVPASNMIETPRPERTIFLLEALAHLNPREQEIIRLYYWEDQPHEKIARDLGLTASNVTKIRQRTVNKLRELLNVKGKGGRDEDRVPGK